MNFMTKAKIFQNFEAFAPMLQIWKGSNQSIVFTNGCFDLIHHGHVDSLQKAAFFGTKLIVGLNSDDSVRRLKGENRPILEEMDRAGMLAALEVVDAVIIFEEDDPADLISKIVPNVLVKGAHYKLEEIAGHETVLKNGGRVEILDIVEGISTSELINRIRKIKNPKW